MGFILGWIIYSIVILIAAYIIPGVRVSNFGTALIVAIVIGIINILLRPLIVLLTLPITILTLGLFIFVINAFLFWLAAQIVPGFKIDNFGSAILFAIVVAIINGFFGMFIFY